MRTEGEQIKGGAINICDTLTWHQHCFGCCKYNRKPKQGSYPPRADRLVRKGRQKQNSKMHIVCRPCYKKKQGGKVDWGWTVRCCQAHTAARKDL